MANRFQQLLSIVPSGSFYAGTGQVIPSRGNSPYQFLLSPVPANRTFNVYVNNVIRGEVTSDGTGQAVINVVLDQGRQDIVLVDEVTQARFPVYVNVRVSATIQAAHADVIDSIDTSLDATESALSLETAGPLFIEDVYGKPVQQPNSLGGGWLIDSYRRLVRRLRQAFRVFGSKVFGLQQVVSAFTSALPLRVPEAWKARWFLGLDLAPNGNLADHARLTASPLTNLNARSANFVHAAFGGPGIIFPPPFVQPPTPQPLTVLFSVGWNNGSVTISGIDPLGNALAEVFTPLAAQPLGVAETVVGQGDFAVVSGAVQTAVVAGTAAIGVALGRFIVIDSIGGYNTPIAHALAYLITPDRLRWSGGPTVDISASTFEVEDGVFVPRTITLAEPDQVVNWFSLPFEPGGGFAVANEHFLALEFDFLGPVIIDLSNVDFGGGASPRTAAQVATSVNTYLARETTYGATKAHSTVTCPSGAAITAADPGDAGAVQITFNDGLHATTTFAFVIANPPPGGTVGITYTALDTAATIAGRLALAIYNVGAALRISAGAVVAVVTVQNDFGGTQGNQAITRSAAAIAAGFLAPAMTGGGNSPYATVAAAVTGINTLGTVLQFLTPGPLKGLASCIKIHGWGADAAKLVLGEPRYSTTLSAPAVYHALSLSTPANPRLPTVNQVILLHAAVLDSSSVTAAGFIQPSHPTAVEVYFDGAWHGGGVEVQGTAFGTGDPVVEDLLLPAARVVVAQPLLTAASVDLGITITDSSNSLGNVRPGDFLRINSGGPSGTGAYVEYVDTVGQVRLVSPGIGANFAGNSFTVTRGMVVKGLSAFATVNQLTNLAPTVSGTVGTATLAIIDGALHGYDIRVGRSVRQNGTGGAGRTITTVGTANTAAFQDTVLPLKGELSDVGGFLLIQGATADGGTNNGLHPIFSVSTGGFNAVFIRHQDTDRGGRFFNETLPGGATWRLYSAGEVQSVVAENLGAGTLTLYPPGITVARPSGARIELASEMPFQATGLVGPGTITVECDRNYLPAGAASDSLTLTGTVVPDRWRAHNQTTPANNRVGFFSSQRLELVGSGVDTDSIGTTDQTFDIALETPDVLAYRGFTLRASFWVQQHVTVANQNLRIDFSFDGGVTFTPGTASGASANPEPVAGTFLFSASVGGSLDPHLVQATIALPFNAEACTVRLRHIGTAAGPPDPYISVEKATVVALPSTALFMGLSTLPANEQTAKFGELLYVWSPEPLTSQEKLALGIPDAPASVPTVTGQIDNVADAHSYWERFDVSEYDTASDPLNVKGTYNEIDWLAATLTNMKVVVGTPPRSSVVVPTEVSLVENEALTFLAPSNALLAHVTEHEGALHGKGGVGASISAPVANIQTLTDPKANFNATIIGQNITIDGSEIPTNDGTFPITARTPTTVLYTNALGKAEPQFNGEYLVRVSFPEESFDDEILMANGVPVPATESVTAGVLPWRFVGPAPSQSIQVASVGAGDPAAQAVFDPAASYTLTYRRMMRAEPDPFDLGLNFPTPATDYLNYLWLVDAVIYRRVEVTPLTFETDQQLAFLNNFRATLTVVSNSDQTTAALVQDNGLVKTQVPVANWRFLDPATVEIDSPIFDPNSIYTLTYVALEPTYPPPAQVLIEERSSNVSQGDVLTQRYRAVEPGELVNSGDRYHQLRVTIRGVVDVRDIEIAGLGLRGVHVGGAAPYAPGIILP